MYYYYYYCVLDVAVRPWVVVVRYVRGAGNGRDCCGGADQRGCSSGANVKQAAILAACISGQSYIRQKQRVERVGEAGGGASAGKENGG